MKNSRGATLIITTLVIASLSVLVSTFVFSRANQLTVSGKSYRRLLEKNQVAHDLKVIFANPDLCKSVLKISGSNFSVPNIYSAAREGSNTRPTLKSNPKVGIKKMIIENVQNLPGGLKQADFSIVTQELKNESSNTEKKSTVTGIYMPSSDGSGAVTDCRIVVTPEDACSSLGFQWLTAESRCNICEKMGGSNTSGKCSLISLPKKTDDPKRN